jgi:mevalonate kinase
MAHNPMATSSAPGKIILFGEHTVVYGYPALAVPVTQVQATATVSENSRGGIMIEAPNINLSAELSGFERDNPLAFVINSVFSSLQISNPPACTVYLQSTIPVASGLGSGAAISIAIIRALSTFLGQPMQDEQVNKLAFETEKLYHGTPSGIDNTVITYAKPVYYIRKKPIRTFHVGAAFTILIADTGVSAPTKESVAAVRMLWESNKHHWEKVFSSVGEIVWCARQAIERGDSVELGKLMNANHSLLQELSVSSKELDQLVNAALKSGALGAKLSGGGRGGNMIALVEKENAQAVSRVLSMAGAKRTIATQVG